jgi:flagellar biosynthesis protein FliQ
MRTSGTHSDATLSFIPALLLIFMVVLLVGGVDVVLRHIDEFCSRIFAAVIGWFKAL